MGLEIFRNGIYLPETSRVDASLRAGTARAKLEVGSAGANAERDLDLPHHTSNLAPFQRPPMVRARARRSRRTLQRVQPIHAVGLFGAPPPGKIARVANAARAGRDKIGIKRQNHVGLIEAVLRGDVLAEREPCAGARAFAARRP